MKLTNQLKEIGLNLSEIKVYLYILENGLLTPPTIAQGTGIQRANSYQVLKKLKDLSLIAEQRQGKRKAYIARSP